MRDQEQRLALTLVQRQHSLLSQDLHFNVASVDTRGVTGSLDLVGYFTEDSYGCEERVWVELKAWGTTTFDTYFQKEQEELPSRLVKEQRKDTSLCGVLLVRLGIYVHVRWIRLDQGHHHVQLQFNVYQHRTQAALKLAFGGDVHMCLFC